MHTRVHQRKDKSGYTFMSGCFFGASKVEEKCPDDAQARRFDTERTSLIQLQNSLIAGSLLRIDVDALLNIITNSRDDISSHARSITNANADYKEGIVNLIDFLISVMNGMVTFISNPSILPIYISTSADSKGAVSISPEQMEIIIKGMQNSLSLSFNSYKTAIRMLEQNINSVTRAEPATLFISSVVYSIKQRCFTIMKRYANLLSFISSDIGHGSLGSFDGSGSSFLQSLDNSYASSFLSFDSSYGWEVFAASGFIFILIVSIALYICTNKMRNYNPPTLGKAPSTH